MQSAGVPANADRAMLEAAFSGGPYGDHALWAEIRDVTDVRGPIPEVGVPMSGHVQIVGRFVTPDGEPCGRFRRCMYRHGDTLDLELWLGGLHVDGEWRGKMMSFTRRSLKVCASWGVRRVRGTAGLEVGGYALAREGFGFDPARLPGFGADGKGVGRGGEGVSLPLEGEYELARALGRAIVDAAVADGRVSESEGKFLRSVSPDSPAQLAAFDEDLSRRLLAGARWPIVLELSKDSAERSHGR